MARSARLTARYWPCCPFLRCFRKPQNGIPLASFCLTSLSFFAPDTTPQGGCAQSYFQIGLVPDADWSVRTIAVAHGEAAEMESADNATSALLRVAGR